MITGASRGIGAAIAEAFVAHGARVVLAARTVSDMDELADRMHRSGGEVRVIGTDITDPAQVDAAVQLAVSEFGRLDIAVNNAGVSQKRIDFHELAPEAFDHTLSLNVQCLFRAMQSQIKAMLVSGGGSIVNIGSVTSVIGVPNMAAYCASRHAVVGLSKSAALDYAKRGIRINVVAPGPIMTAQLKAGAAATPEGSAMMASYIPMGRIGAPEDVSGAVVFMASDAASFVTGAYLPVDGGYVTP